MLNTEALPGILLVLGGSTLSWGGTAQFYGVIYCEGPMNTSHGTGDIHGMVVTNDRRGHEGHAQHPLQRRLHREPRPALPLDGPPRQNTWREVQPQ